MMLNRNSHRDAVAGKLLPVLFAAIATLLSACGRDPAPVIEEARLVRTVVVTDDSNAQLAEYTAEVRARIETDISFQVGGKLINRAVDVGAIVRRGDVLAGLDNTDQALGVDAARSAVAAAQAEYERAQSDEARYRDLLERGLTTRAAHLAQQTAVKTSQSRLEQALSDLRLQEQRLSYTTLRADDDGVVTAILAEAGSVVAAGQPVMNIARPDELQVVFDVPDSRIEELRDGASVQFAFTGASGELFAAQVREISPSADPVTRTYQVRATITEPPANLRLGMTVTVMLPRSTGPASIRLPSTALFQSGEQPAVWLVRKDMTLELRRVEIERYESDSVLLAAGLSRGDRVVTAGVHRLADGEPVRLLDEARP